QADCVDLRREAAGPRPNPFAQGPLTFSVFDAQGNSLPQARLKQWATAGGALAGLDAGWRTEVRLPSPAAAGEVMLTTFADQATLVALGANGKRLAGASSTGPQKVPQIVRLQTADGSAGILLVEITTRNDELAVHQVCRIRTVAVPVVAIARDLAGREIGRYPAQQGVIDVPGAGVRDIDLDGGGRGYVLDQVCWVVGLTGAESAARQELMTHIVDETARWHDEGAVLQPYTQYRITVTST